MNLSNSTKAWLLIALVTAFVGSGCKSNGGNTQVQPPVKVKNFQITTERKPNNDEWLFSSITLTTGKFSVAGITLPITDPVHNYAEYGLLSLQPNLCGNSANCPDGNEVTMGVGLNLTTITQAKGVSPLLPNGAALPVGGLENSTVFALPVADTGALVYLAFGKNVALLGTAVPFAELDVVGSYIPGANLFVPVTITTPKGPFTLMPGIFTGKQTKQTGVGFFADIAGVIPQSPLMASLTAYSIGAGLSGASGPLSVKSKLNLGGVIPNDSAQVKLYQSFKKVEKYSPQLRLK